VFSAARQDTVTGRVNKPPAMTLDEPIDEDAIGRKGSQRRFFILAHEATIALDVGAQDSGEFTLQDSPFSDRDTSAKSTVWAHSMLSPNLERAK
jgi:hypothetical protein